MARWQPEIPTNIPLQPIKIGNNRGYTTMSPYGQYDRGAGPLTAAQRIAQLAAFKTGKAQQAEGTNTPSGAEQGYQDRGTGEASNNGMSPYTEWNASPAPVDQGTLDQRRLAQMGGSADGTMIDATPQGDPSATGMTNVISRTGRVSDYRTQNHDPNAKAVASYTGFGRPAVPGESGFVPGAGAGGGAASPINQFMNNLIARAQSIQRAGAPSFGRSLAVGNITRALAGLGPLAMMQNYNIPMLGLEGRRVGLAERQSAPGEQVSSAVAGLALSGRLGEAAQLHAAIGGTPYSAQPRQMFTQNVNPYTGEDYGFTMPPNMQQEQGKYADRAAQDHQRGPGAIR